MRFGLKLGRSFLSRNIYVFLVLSLIFPPQLFAADMEAVLDSADGSSVFTVKDSGNVKVTDIDSDGNIVAKGCIRLDSGGAECTNAEQLMVDGAIGVGVTSITGALQVAGDEARFGSGGTVDYATGDGDVFIQNNLEVDGIIHGNISGSASSMAYDRLTAPAGISGIHFSTFSNAWTSSSTNDFFTITQNGAIGAGVGVLNLVEGAGNPTGGSMLRISNADVDVNHISADNFVVSQDGGVTMSGNMLANGSAAVHIWTSGVTSGDYFTISNSGNFSNGSVLKLSEGGAPTGGAILAISNTAANVNHISANNFSVSQSGGIVTSGAATMGGDLTVSGDDLYMATNTTGAILVADGVNFNPVVMAGDCVISSTGVTTCTASSANAIRYDQITAPLNNSGINFGNFNNAWTSSGGTHLWTSTNNTSGNYFTIANAGVLTSGGAVLRLNQNNNATGGSVISIENADTDVTTISAPNFIVAQQGNVTMGGDLTVSGDDLYMATNTAGAILVADGANFNPVVMSGDCTISSTGAIICNAATALTASSVIPFNKIGPPLTTHGIDFADKNSTWTSTTGQHVWTAAVTSGNYFTISNAGAFDASSSVLRLSATGASSGGTVLGITNTDADVASISAPNFTVSQSGGVTAGGNLAVSAAATMGGDLTVSGDDLYMATNTTGAILVADGTNFNPVVMAGDCVISSTGVTTCTASSANAIRYDQITAPLNNSGINFGNFNNAWTSSGGTHLWTSTNNTSGNYFTIANAGVLTSGGAVLRLNQNNNATGGSVISIENADTDVTTISAPNFTVAQQGNVTMGGDLTVSGDDLYMATNTTGAILVADGTNFNPVVMSGDCTISSAGAITCNAATALTSSSVIPYSKIGPPLTSHGINFGAFNNTWTNSTGTHLWTGANTGTNYFTIANTGVLASGGALLRLNQDHSVNPTGGSMISIENYDTDVTTISAPNFTVAQQGNVTANNVTANNATLSGDLTVTGDDLYMATNTTGAILVADGTNFNPVVMSGDCTISSAGAITCNAATALTSSSVIPYSKIGPPLTSHGINFGAFNNTWTNSTGTHLWTGANTGTNYFTIANTGVLASGGALLRLNQDHSVNPTGGSIISIENQDTDVTTISAPNFTVTQQGNVIDNNMTMSGDLTVNGGQIYMDTNTVGSILVANGTNFNPVVMSGDCTVTSNGSMTCNASSVRFDQIADPNQLNGIYFGTFNNTWTSTTGTQVWTAANTNTNFFTIANTGVLASGGALLRLNQDHSVNPTGGSVLSIENADTDVTTISAPNFTVAQQGNVTANNVTANNATLSGDLTVSGDDLYMATNTTGAILVADGTNFNPVVMSGDCTISSAGAITCNAATALTSSSVVPFNKVGPPVTSHGINLGTFDATWTSTSGNSLWQATTGNRAWVSTTGNNVWTSTTGTNLWTGANTGTNYFTIANTGVLASGGAVLRLNQDHSVNPTGGSILSIENADTDVTTISAPNFTLSQRGHVTMGGDLTVSGDDLYMATNTTGAILVADGTNFNPVVMSGDCTISSTGAITCNAATALTSSSVVPFNKVGPPVTSHGINLGTFDATWTSTTGNSLWQSTTGNRAWVSTTGNNVWTSGTGTNLWTGANTGTNYFTIANTGVLVSGGAVLRLNQDHSVNPTGGSILSIENADTDVTTISAPNFTVAQQGNVTANNITANHTTLSGDLTVGGDDLYMATNTTGAILVADGTNFNPVVMAGDCTINSTGAIACAPSGGLTTSSVVPFNKVGPPVTSHGINLGTFDATWTSTTGNSLWQSTTGNRAWVSTTGNNVWTSTTGTNLWTGANTSTNFFTIANSGVLASGGAVLRLNQNNNATGGSVISIENYDTDVTTISAPNFTVAQQGNVTANNTTLSGDLTVGGDDLYMTTNTSGAVLVADGTNFNPVVMSGDCTILSTGVINCNAASALTADSVVPFNKVGPPVTAHGINLGTFDATWTSTTGNSLWQSTAGNRAWVSTTGNNVWTSTTGTNLWTGANTSTNFFTIANSGVLASGGSVLRLNQNNNATGGSVISIENYDTDVTTISAPNFTVAQQGNVTANNITANHTTLSGDLTVSGDDLYMATNTTGAILVADGTNFNPVVMSGDCTISSTGVINCNAASALTADSVVPFNKVGPPVTAHGINLGTFDATWTSTSGNQLWQSTTGNRAWVSTTGNNVWTSSTGTNLWTGANTNTNYFTIANSGVLAAGGSVLRLNQNNNASGGSVISIENYDTDVTTISAPNFTVAQQGNVTANNITANHTTLSGDLTVSGDDLYMATNTTGAILVADGTNFNPVVMAGDCTISSTGAIACAPSGGLTTSSVVPFNKVGPPVTSHGINLGTFDATWTSTTGNSLWQSTTGNRAWVSTTGNNVWTSSIGTNLWTGANTSTNYFTIANTGVLASGGALLRLNQDHSVNPTGGSILSIENADTDVTTISAPNFTVAQQGNVTANNITANHTTLSGDLTVSGDDLYMATNTVGAVLVADGTNFNPVVMSGDCTISSTGVINCNAASALTVDSVVPFNKVGPPVTAHGIGLGIYDATWTSTTGNSLWQATTGNRAWVSTTGNNVWTSTTGTNLWTGANASGNFFTIANSGVLASGGSVLRLNQNNNATGGSVISIENYDTDVTTISAPNFTVAQQGNVTANNITANHTTLSGDLTVSGDDLYMATNTVGAVLVADGTNFNPVVMSGDCTISSTGVINCNAASALTADSVVPFNKVGPPVTAHGINLGAFDATWTSTTGNALWQSTTGNRAWVSTTGNNVWTSTTGTNLWTGANTGTNYFTIANTGVLASGGAVLRLNQDHSVNPTGGSILSIENADTDVTTISAPNFTVAQQGNVTANNITANHTTLSGDLTVSGDDLYMATNTSGAVLVGDGTNFNPVVMAGDCTISSTGSITCAPSGGLTNASVIPFNKVGPPVTAHGINLGTFDATWTSTTGNSLWQATTGNRVWVSTTGNNVWTSTTGTNLWTGANTGTNYFTIANTGVLASGGAVLRLNQDHSVNPTGGSIISIENADTDVTTISAPNFTVAQQGNVTAKNVTLSGDLTISGDDLYMATNTSGAILVGDGTNFNPVVMAGDCTISSTGSITCAPSGGLTNASVIPFNKVGPPVTAHGINLGTFDATWTSTTGNSLWQATTGNRVWVSTTGNNVWTSTTGTNVWTGANTSGDYFTIANSGDRSAGSVLKLFQGGNSANTGGSVLEIVNKDTDVTTISAPSFTVAQQGHVTLGGDLTVGGDDLYMATNTSGAVLVADGTNFNPVVMSGDCTISSTGAMTCSASSGLSSSSVIPYNKIGTPDTAHGINFGTKDNTWTSTTGNQLWQATTGNRAWVSTTGNNVWTSTTGTNLWTGANTSTNFFTIANTGVLASGGAVLRLNQGSSVNPTGGSVLSIENYDTDVTSISAPKFTLSQQGNMTVGGDLKVDKYLGVGTTPLGDFHLKGTSDTQTDLVIEPVVDGGIITFNSYWNGANDKYLTSHTAFSIYHNTGTANEELKFMWAPSGTAGNNVTYSTAMSINQNGDVRIGGALATTTSSVIPFNKIGTPETAHGINFGAFDNTWTSTTGNQLWQSTTGNRAWVSTTGNNVWTSTTGTNLWTGANTSGDYFTIANSGDRSAGSVLKLFQGGSSANTGGSVLEIVNKDTDVTTITAPNFTLSQQGHVTMSGDLTVGGDDLYMATNTSGAVLVADGTNFNPVVMSGDCTISSTGAMTCSASSGLSSSSVIPYNKIGTPDTAHGINFGTKDNTWTSTTGNQLWQATTGNRAWVSTTGNNVWTSSTGTNLWTGANTSGDYFTIANSGARSAGSVLKLFQGGSSANTGGSVLEIVNKDTDVNSILASNFVVNSSGNVGIGTTSPTAQFMITNVTTGGLFRVNDESSDTDTTPFVITNDGLVGVSASIASGLSEIDASLKVGNIDDTIDVLSLNRASPTASTGPDITTWRSRGVTLNTPVNVQDGDELFQLRAYGFYAGGPGDWGNYAAMMGIYVDGTPGASDMPARWEFATSPDGSVTPITHMTIKSNGNVGIGTTTPSAKLTVAGGMSVENTNQPNTWTSTTGTNLWTGGNTSTHFFTIANTGVLASGGALLRLNQSKAANPTGGSILSIENYDTDVTTISAPNFTVSQSGGITLKTNTAGAVLVADGTNFNPVVMSGDCTISSTGAMTCSASSGLTTSSVIPYNKIGTPDTAHGINFGTKDNTWTSTTGNQLWQATTGNRAWVSTTGNNVWTSTTGTNLWTGANTSGDYFTIANSGARSAGSVLKLFQGGSSANTGGSVLEIVNKDTDVTTISAPNFTLSQQGHVTMSGDLTVGGDDLYMATNTSGAVLVADGTNFNPVVMSGDCTISSAGAMTCSASSGLTTSSVIPYNKIGTPDTAHGINFGAKDNTWTSTTGNQLWQATTGNRAWVSTTGNNVWTSSTGTNLWTGANTTGNFFTIANTGVLAAGGAILRLNQGASVNPTGGSVLSIENADTDVTSITAPNFTVSQSGHLAIGRNNNIAIGNNALVLDQSGGTDNVAIGSGALDVLTTGDQNIAIGTDALGAEVDAVGSIAIGYGSANVDATGPNVTIGRMSASTATGFANVVIGDYAGFEMIAGNYNVYLGDEAGGSSNGENNTGNSNVFIGNDAGSVNTTANYSIAIGDSALFSSKTGSSQVAIGYKALYLATAGSNTALGYQAGDSITTGTGNILLGYDVDAPAASSSYHLNIGNTIYGDMTKGNVGIGSSTTSATLTVTGGMHVVNTTQNNIWTSTTGTNLWTGANTSGDYFTIANSGARSAGSVLKLFQGGSSANTGGSVLEIVNKDTDVTTISAPNFTVSQQGAVTMSGDLTVGGDDLYMATNTSGAVLVADGTNFNPVVMSGDCTISSAGAMTCSASSGLSSASVIPFNKVGPPVTAHGINLGTFDATWTSTTGNSLWQATTGNRAWVSTTGNNVWTSSTGTNLWTGANTSGNFFTIANTGVLASGGAVLRLNQGASVNPTGGSVLSIENTDTDVTSISAPNFSVSQQGNVIMSGNLGVGTTTPNSELHLKAKDGTGVQTDFTLEPVGYGAGISFNSYYDGANDRYVTSNSAFSLFHDITIGHQDLTLYAVSSGSAGNSLTYTSALTIKGDARVLIGGALATTTSSVIPFNKVGPPVNAHGIGLGTFDATWTSTTGNSLWQSTTGNRAWVSTTGNNVWTSTTGTNLWTGANTSGDYFTIANSGARTAGSVLKLFQGGSSANSGGSVLEIVNKDTDVTTISAPNFTVSQQGHVTMSGDLTVSGDDLYMATNTTGAILVADGTNFNPVVMSGDCTISSTGAMTCSASSGLTTSSVIPYNKIGTPDTAHGINFGTKDNTWTSTTGNQLWQSTSGNRAWVSTTGNNVWTSSTGTNLWTGANTSGDYFTIANSGARTAGSVLKLFQGGSSANSGGSVLEIVNKDTDVKSISAANFTVSSSGNVMITNGGSGNSLLINDDGTDTDTTPFVVDSLGNVGIGQVSAGARLDVSKVDGAGGYAGLSIRASTDTPCLVVENTFASGNYSYCAHLSVITNHAGTGDTYGGIQSAILSTDTSGNWFGFIGVRQSQNTNFNYDPGDQTAVSNGEYLPGIAFAGTTSNSGNIGANTVIGAAMNGVVDSTVTAGNMPTSLVFRTSKSSSSGLTEYMRINSQGSVGIGTTSPSAKLEVSGGMKVTNTTQNNIWTSTTGTNLWTGANTSGDYFTIANSGARTAGSVLKLFQGGSSANSGGSVLEIVNQDTDVTTITAPNFTVSQQGAVTMSGDLTVSGDDLYMATNTTGALLVADGTNFNPVVMSGDCTISSTGVMTCSASSGLSSSSVIPYNKIGTPDTAHGINFGTKDNTWTSTTGNQLWQATTGNRAWVSTTGNNVWTSSTGTNLWTGANTSGNFFTIANTGVLASGGAVLRLNQGASVNPTGGSVLSIENYDTDVTTISAPNFSLGQQGNLTITNVSSSNSLLINDDGTADTSPFVIDATGEVGIGASTPVHDLHIYDTVGAPTIQIEGPSADDLQSEIYLVTLSQNGVGLGTASTRGWGITANGNAYGTATAQNDLWFEYFNGTSWYRRMVLDGSGLVGINTETPSAKLTVAGGMSVENTNQPNTWTSTTGTNLWTGGNTSTHFFTIANTGVLASGGALLRLNQSKAANPTGGSILSIENYDTDVTTISAPNFTVSQSGGITLKTNTVGAVLVADGTNFNPVVMSGDCTISSTGAMTCSASSGLTSSSVIPYNKIGTPDTAHGINFGTKDNTWTSTTGNQLWQATTGNRAWVSTTGNNVWTSSTGTNLWTGANTATNFFTIANTGVLASGGALLRLNQSKAANPTGGSIISIENYDTDVTTISAPNFTVSQSGNLTMGMNGSIAIGSSALAVNTGVDNVAMGSGALDVNTTGTSNIAIGTNALGANTVYTGNIAIGRHAMGLNDGANYSVAVGEFALFTDLAGSNTAIGYQALYSMEGTVSTAVGRNALYLAKGNYNTALGGYAGDDITTGSRNIIIGYDIDAPSATGSYQLNIGNAIYGDLSKGNVGIGSSTTSAKLTVSGGMHVVNTTENNVWTSTTGTNLWTGANTSTNFFTIANTGVLASGGAVLRLNQGASVNPTGGSVLSIENYDTDVSSITAPNFTVTQSGAISGPIFTKSVSVEYPQASENITLFYADATITVTEVRAVLVGNSTPSVNWSIKRSSDRSIAGTVIASLSATSAETTRAGQAANLNTGSLTVTASSWVWLSTTAVSGNVESLGITIMYKYNTN